MARTVAFRQVDVFTSRPFEGNPVAVILDAQGLDTAAMQRIARWTHLSETTFVLPASTSSASYRVRIFTPAQELPFAGHPSVGTAHAAVEAGLAEPRAGRLVQECCAGLLPILVEGEGRDRRFWARAPEARELTPSADAKGLLDAALAGLPRGALDPRLYDNGPRWWLAELASEADVRGHRPDLEAIARLTTATRTVGLAVYAAAGGPDHQWVVRAYCPADGIPEDPVTGSANASIGALLRHQGRLRTGDRYVVSQGREVGRDGKVAVRLEEDGVWIGDRAVTVISGEILLDPVNEPAVTARR